MQGPRHIQAIRHTALAPAPQRSSTETKHRMSQNVTEVNHRRIEGPLGSAEILRDEVHHHFLTPCVNICQYVKVRSKQVLHIVIQ